MKPENSPPLPTKPQKSAIKSPKENPEVGIRELARQLGISIGTVSRALNNRYGVNSHTRARVLEQARRLNYVPNSAARRLKDSTVLTVGLFFAPFLSPSKEVSPTALRLIDLFRERLASQNMMLQVIFYASDQDLKDQSAINQIDVAVFYGEFSPVTFRVIHEIGIPAVLLHHKAEFPRQIAILVDVRQAGFRAVEYLAALGHERLCLVTGPKVEMHTTDLCAGFFDALEEFGLPRHAKWGVELSPEAANKEGAAEALIPILTQAVRPTGIVFASDWMALGGYKAAQQVGLRVPHDLSIVGHDNLPLAAEISPPLTTFDVEPNREADLLVQLVADMERNRLSENAVQREIHLVPELVKRQSCVCLRRHAL